MTIIKSSSLTIKNQNVNKMELHRIFLTEYRRAVQFYINHFWNKRSLDKSKPTKKDLVINKFYNYTPSFETILSGRALKAAKTQANGIIKGTIQKHNERLYRLGELQKEKGNFLNLQRVISATKISKPKIGNIAVALDSNNCELVESKTSKFDLNLNLYSLFNREYKKKIGKNNYTLLLNKHRHYIKLETEYKNRLNGILLGDDYIDVKFEQDTVPLKKSGDIVGIDQGIKNIFVAAFSDGTSQESTKCPHGHDLHSICQKLTNTKKGTKSFKKAQEHRTNYVNWSLNKLNLDNTKELRLEKLSDIGRGIRKTTFLNSFPYPLIKTKLQDRCQQIGVLFVEQSCMYRSQRCSCCGFVLKKNRNGKTFKCANCLMTMDADLNAARNHLVDLPPIFTKVSKESTKNGWFWPTI